MKKYLVDNNSDTLLIFFTGWGCDEYEFEHLEAKSNVLFLYDYTDLKLDFDFSKYKKFNLIAFSAGVFIATLFDFDFEISKKIAISGNPYLFDGHLGLTDKMQQVLCSITEENADDFAKNYLIKTEEEWQKFHHSKRTIESCMAEFANLKELYKTHKQNIKDIFDSALFGDNDRIFNLSVQKDFYGNRLHLIKDTRHNLFFKVNSFEQLFQL